MLKITVTQGPDRGRTFEIGTRPEVIGRQNASLLLSDHKVSRQHAEIVRKGEGWIVRDLGSSNGTYLNGERIEGAAPLSPGDQVQVGESVLTAERAGATGAGAPQSPAAGGAPSAPEPSGPLEEDEILSVLVGPAEEEDEAALAGLAAELGGAVGGEPEDSSAGTGAASAINGLSSTDLELEDLPPAARGGLGNQPVETRQPPTPKPRLNNPRDEGHDRPAPIELADPMQPQENDET